MLGGGLRAGHACQLRFCLLPKGLPGKLFASTSVNCEVCWVSTYFSRAGRPFSLSSVGKATRWKIRGDLVWGQAGSRAEGRARGGRVPRLVGWTAGGTRQHHEPCQLHSVCSQGTQTLRYQPLTAWPSCRLPGGSLSYRAG